MSVKSRKIRELSEWVRKYGTRAVVNDPHEAMNHAKHEKLEGLGSRTLGSQTHRSPRCSEREWR